MPITVAIVEDNADYRLGTAFVLRSSSGCSCVGMYETAEELIDAFDDITGRVHDGSQRPDLIGHQVVRGPLVGHGDGYTAVGVPEAIRSGLCPYQRRTCSKKVTRLPSVTAPSMAMSAYLPLAISTSARQAG